MGFCCGARAAEFMDGEGWTSFFLLKSVLRNKINFFNRYFLLQGCIKLKYKIYVWCHWY